MRDNEVAERLRKLVGQDAVRIEYGIAADRYRGYFARCYLGVDDALAKVRTELPRFEAADCRLFIGELDSVPEEYRREDRGLCVFAMPELRTLDIVDFAKVGTHDAEVMLFNAEEFMSAARAILSRGTYLSLVAHSDQVLAQMLARSRNRVGGVKSALAAIAILCPFKVIFADSAGLKAVFDNAVAPDSAKVIESAVMQVNPEAAEMAEPNTIAEAITNKNMLELWWD